MKKILLLLLLPTILCSTQCQQEQGNAIKGKIENAANLAVVLEQTYYQGAPTNPIKTAADAQGNFKIDLQKPLDAGLYRLSVGAKRMFLVLDGKEKTVEIKADLNTMDKLAGATVAGSEMTACYFQRIQEMFGLLDARQLNPETLKPIVDKGCNALMKSVLSLQLLSSPDGSKFLPDFKKIGESLASEMPGSKYATDYQQILGQVEQAATMQQQTQGGAGTVAVGQAAPEISYPDPTGNIRNLSGLKGKVVLLDFWASWCGPCRRENPHVVEVYKKYKAKGFEIFSVSLDREAGAWKNAIAQDGLLWENHVSDLKHWQSAPAKLYGVSSIPRTFLIGRDGKIAAINPRQNLEQELLKVLN